MCSNQPPSKISVPEAVQCLAREVLNDEGYRIAWVANIAMAFKDEMARSYWDDAAGVYVVTQDELHKAANRAAETFVSLLFKMDKQVVSLSWPRRLWRFFFRS